MTESCVDITIHESQRLEALVHELHRSLETRRINPKFLYESYRQTQRWLAIHKAYSAWNVDSDCARIYSDAYAVAGGHLERERPIAIVGLGCGSGQKEAELARSLRGKSGPVTFLPIDVSPSLALMARDNMLKSFPNAKCHPLVFDLARVEDLPNWINQRIPDDAQKIFTCFGMIPNTEPFEMAARLRQLLKPGGLLLLSANLAPGEDYRAGVERVLPQYDNAPTRDWLLTFLTDLGFEKGDGELDFIIEACSPQEPFLRIAAYFTLTRNRRIEVYEREFQFSAGEKIRVFFSCRYTPGLLSNLLELCGASELGRWITNSGEEGVFLFERIEP